MPLPPRDLTGFFLPGLLHLWGNLLLTLQSAALPGTPRGQPVLAHAVERGASSLQVFRWFAGEPGGRAGDAVALLGVVQELARVPVRDAGLALAVQSDAGPVGVGDAAGFVVGMGRALLGLVRSLPAGAEGRIQVELLAGKAADPLVRITFRPIAGGLPFPVAAEELRAAVGGDARALPAGLELRFPAAPGFLAADA